MSETDRPRRFIAGAVCPRCSVMDRVVVFDVEGRTQRECVHCGFADALDEQGNPGAEPMTGVPAGRLDERPSRRADHTPAQPIRFYPDPRVGRETGRDD